MFIMQMTRSHVETLDIISLNLFTMRLYIASAISVSITRGNSLKTSVHCTGPQKPPKCHFLNSQISRPAVDLFHLENHEGIVGISQCALPCRDPGFELFSRIQIFPACPSLYSRCINVTTTLRQQIAIKSNKRSLNLTKHGGQ